MTVSCANCKFYHQTEKKGDEVWGNIIQKGRGECRKGPPQVMPPNPHYDAWYGQFPGVEDDYWCGEWRERADD